MVSKNEDIFASFLAGLRLAVSSSLGVDTGAPLNDDISAEINAASSLNEALRRLCEAGSSEFGRAIFGPAKVRYLQRKDVLKASLGKQHLCVAIGNDVAADRLGIKGEAIFLDIRQGRIELAVREGDTRTRLINVEVAALLEAIAFHGSLWDVLFPSHHGVAIETIALTFPQFAAERLFGRGGRSDVGGLPTDAQDRLSCFANENTQLLSLDQLARTFSGAGRGPSLNAERTDSGLILRKYNTARSAILDFGSPEERALRDDFVTTYAIEGSEQHREYAICPDAWPTGAAELRLATFDLLNMLAIRRAKLFRSDFGKRVYNVLFPPLVALAQGDAVDDGLAIFPCLNLYRGQGAGFRRTASLSFTIVPVHLGRKDRLRCRSRRASLRELHKLKSSLERSALAAASPASETSFQMHSTAKGYYERIPQEAQLSEQLSAIAADIARRTYALGNEPQRDQALASMIAYARSESRVTTLLLQVGWRPADGFAQPWERWLSGHSDPTFEDALYRTLFYEDFLFPSTAYTSRHAVQLRDFSVGNTLGADMTGMTLFNPQDRLKICLYADAFEAYPNYSIIRWATWQIYIDSALTAMRALICSFHPLMDTASSLPRMMNVLRQMVREFVEFYDLDIREYFYRKEYEKLRERMQVEADYRQLKEKFAAAKDDELLKEQRLINKLLVALTIATVTISVISTVAQMNRLDVVPYIVLSTVAAGGLTGLGYALFDPIKHGFARFAQPLASRWRNRHDS